MLSILSMISRWRGSSFPSTFTGHFSSASGITVWFVKASVCKGRDVVSHLHVNIGIICEGQRLQGSDTVSHSDVDS